MQPRKKVLSLITGTVPMITNPPNHQNRADEDIGPYAGVRNPS